MASGSGQNQPPLGQHEAGGGNRGRSVRRPGSLRARGIARRLGRGRGRGMGRGRGQPRLPLADIARQQQQRREERQQRIRDMINRLQIRRLREILLVVAERQPGIFFDIWEEQGNNNHHERRDGQPHWCTCGRCVVMPTADENICCTGTPENCLSMQPDMETLVLDPYVLGLAQALRNDILALNHNRQDPNRALRHAAYRQYTLWIHGRLGRGNRRVIPSCVVLRIRESFPDPYGNYVGYMPNRLI